MIKYEEDKEVTKIRHQTESEKHGYITIIKEKVTEFIKKYKGKVKTIGKLVKFENLGEEITDVQLKELFL